MYKVCVCVNVCFFHVSSISLFYISYFACIFTFKCAINNRGMKL